MENLDLAVLRGLRDWRAAGRRALLATVVRTWGSSPRPVGSIMAMADDGSVVGSVSGGCIEDDLIHCHGRGRLPSGAPALVKYGVTADEAHRFGLPCGGTIQLVIEPLSTTSRIDELLERVSRRELVSRVLDLRTGAVRLGPGSPDQPVHADDTTLTTLHGPRWRLLIIGAGQLSSFLAQIAGGMDYHVTVCDPREEYRATWHVPGVEVVHMMPDDFIIDSHPDRRCAVVALTHDPKLDDLALMEALRSDAFYVGAIGSRVNNARRRERLREFDLSEAQLQRLHGPIGLHIGSRIPSEIAISILAEMTAVKNGIAIPRTAP